MEQGLARPLCMTNSACMGPGIEQLKCSRDLRALLCMVSEPAWGQGVSSLDGVFMPSAHARRVGGRHGLLRLVKAMLYGKGTMRRAGNQRALRQTAAGRHGKGRLGGVASGRDAFWGVSSLLQGGRDSTDQVRHSNAEMPCASGRLAGQQYVHKRGGANGWSAKGLEGHRSDAQGGRESSA